MKVFSPTVQFMEDFAVFTVLNHSGSFGMNFVKFKKNKYVIYRLRSVLMVKNCDLGLENAALGLRSRAAFSRPRSQFFTIRTSQPANNIYLSLGTWPWARADPVVTLPWDEFWTLFSRFVRARSEYGYCYTRI